MQSVTGVLSLAFFLGLIYRSASLYHPQRRAMLHLKNQRGKVKEKKPPTKVPRQPWVDLSPLGSRPVRMLMLAAGAAGFGLYTPAFYIVSTLILAFQPIPLPPCPGYLPHLRANYASELSCRIESGQIGASIIIPV